MPAEMFDVRLSASGKKGLLGRWDLDKPAIMFKPGNTYTVTREAYERQKHILDLLGPSPTKKKSAPVVEAVPVAVEVPKETSEPSPPAEEPSADTTSAPEEEPKPEATEAPALKTPPSRKYGANRRSD